MATISSIDITNISADSLPLNPINDSSSSFPLEFDSKYKGDALTQRVAEILNISSIQGWSIVDSHENLALVHYDSDCTPEHGHLRGVLVDIEVGAIVATSFGYTPIAVMNELVEVDGIISVKDQENVVHKFSPENIVIKRVFEGVVMRVIWHKGKSYRITHRKIQPHRSRWGSSPAFSLMYEQAGGPTDEQLFDVTKQYSDSCYIFLISHPSLLIGTRQKINSPYVVCLAHCLMDIKRPSEDIAHGISNFVSDPEIDGSVNKSFIHNPELLTLSEANHHLKFGYFNDFETEDPRQLTGEAIIMYRTVDGHPVDAVKIHSISYEWRTNMRGNNPNIMNQFYSMLGPMYNDVNEDSAWNNLKKNLIILPPYSEVSLKQLFDSTQSILTIPMGPVERDDFTSRDSRIHLLWMNYVLSLPTTLQESALDILSQFKDDRLKVISWLQTIESKTKNIETSEFSSRVKNIVTSSRELARKRVQERSNFSNKGAYIKLPVLIKQTIRNLINKEGGPSLYKLVREMKGPKSPVIVPGLPTDPKSEQSTINDTACVVAVGESTSTITQTKFGLSQFQTSFGTTISTEVAWSDPSELQRPSRSESISWSDPSELQKPKGAANMY